VNATLDKADVGVCPSKINIYLNLQLSFLKKEPKTLARRDFNSLVRSYYLKIEVNPTLGEADPGGLGVGAPPETEPIASKPHAEYLWGQSLVTQGVDAVGPGSGFWLGPGLSRDATFSTSH
jgi:hypothetical protein